MKHTLLIPMSLLVGCALEAPPTALESTEEEEIPCTFLKGLPSEMDEPPLPAEIVTREDFNALALSSPLTQLSPGSFERFTDSLVFHEKGIASFRYVDLEAELTPEEIDEFYMMLGRRKDDDTIRDYYCAGRATCRQEQGAVCITTNC